MQAIEFKSKEQDGFIKIPKKYLNEISGSLRVIILVPEHKNRRGQGAAKKPKFSALRIKTKGLKFNRDELHER